MMTRIKLSFALRQRKNAERVIALVIKQAGGCYKGTLRTVSIQAYTNILPNIQKT